MSRKTREERAEWLKQNRCFACGSPLSNSPSRFYCIRHWIRYGLRKRNLFFSKTAYKLPLRSRVRLERIKRRRFIVNYLRSRFLAVSTKHVEPFLHIREALLFLDEMWTTLHLHHSFPLRSARLGALVQYLMRMDGFASGKLKRPSGWRGSYKNIHRGPSRKPTNGRDGNSNKALDLYYDPPQRHD